MLSPIPRHSEWVLVLLSSSFLPAFPVRADGSACATSFSRIAQRSLTLRPAHSPSHQFVTLYTRGFSHFVTSMTAPIASGWSKSCRVGLSPTGKRRLSTAHALNGHSLDTNKLPEPAKRKSSGLYFPITGVFKRQTVRLLRSFVALYSFLEVGRALDCIGRIECRRLGPSTFRRGGFHQEDYKHYL